MDHVTAGLESSGRPAALLEIGGLPPDYPTPPGWLDARYLEVCLVYVSG
jgi:hypothetical protein